MKIEIDYRRSNMMTVERLNLGAIFSDSDPKRIYLRVPTTRIDTPGGPKTTPCTEINCVDLERGRFSFIAPNTMVESISPDDYEFKVYLR